MSEPNEPFDFQDDDDEESEIWDEHQWEEFMQESDKRTDKYVYFLEKYRDHPDRDKLIAIEMGWFHMLDELDDESDSEDDIIIGEVDEGEEWKQVTGYKPTEYDSFEHFPLYRLAFEFTLEAMDLIQGKLKGTDDESITAFTRSSTIPPAKIAGGFGLGFSLESLGGNIANCKRGLTAANRILTALQEMRDKKILDQETFQYFYSKGKEVRDGLAIYIVELRERFRKGIP